MTTLRFEEGEYRQNCLSKHGTFGRCLESQKHTMLRYIKEKLMDVPGGAITVPDGQLHIHDGTNDKVLKVFQDSIEVQDFQDSHHFVEYLHNLDVASLSVIADYVDFAINHY